VSGANNITFALSKNITPSIVRHITEKLKIYLSFYARDIALAGSGIRTSASEK